MKQLDIDKCIRLAERFVVALENLAPKVSAPQSAQGELPITTIAPWKCPTCKGEMVQRRRKTDGQVFYGCQRFPECKGTRDAEGKSTVRPLPKPSTDTPSDVPF